MDEEEYQTCLTCGFLAKLDAHYEGPPPYVYEFSDKERQTGNIRKVYLSKDNDIYAFPHCHVNAFPLSSEISEYRKENSSWEHQAIRQVVVKKRMCRSWHPYTPGFSPQQHLEQVRMEQLEIDRRRFENEMNQSNRNFQIFLTVVVLIFAIAEIFIPAAFPNGWPWLQGIFGSLPPPPPPMPEF